MKKENYLSKTEQKIIDIESIFETSFTIIPSVFKLWSPKRLFTPSEISIHLAELKTIILDDLEYSMEIKEKEAQILEKAQQEANFIIDQAKKQVEQEPVIEQAKLLAKEIIVKSQAQAEKTLMEAKELRDQLIINGHQYVDHLFNEMEKELLDNKKVLAQNREQLRSSLERKVESSHV